MENLQKRNRKPVDHISKTKSTENKPSNTYIQENEYKVRSDLGSTKPTQQIPEAQAGLEESIH